MRPGDEHLGPTLDGLDEWLTDPRVALDYLERVRWAGGRICPHCGEHARAPYRLKDTSATRRLWRCRTCRRQFTVTVGTTLESTHVPPDRWLLAVYLLCASKQGISAHELHRAIGVTYKTASSMLDLVRYAVGEHTEERSSSAGSRRLSIMLPFDEAVRAVLETGPATRASKSSPTP